MEADDYASSSQIHGGANSFGGPQFNQSSFHGPVTFTPTNTKQTLHDQPCTLPRTVNRRLYTGRTEIAQRLANAFDADTQPTTEGVQVFVIIGLGGTGKSEICLKFAEDKKDWYWGRFWIDCSSHKNAMDSYKLLGEQCGWDTSSMDAIRSSLASCNRRWLVILDNADDPHIDLQEYIPSGGKGNVIVTTRNNECGAHATTGTEMLEGLNDKLCEELLLKVAGIPATSYTIEAEAASKVVKTLGHHTLAIKQAGSYVRAGLCTLAKYPGLYVQQKNELMNYTSVQGKSTYNSVYATFEVSAKWLEHESKTKSDDAQSAGDALQLLQILSFMDRSGQMQHIFAEAAQYAHSISSTTKHPKRWKALNLLKRTSSSIKDSKQSWVKQVPDFAPQIWKGDSGYIRWRRACNMLKKFSFITINGEGQEEELSLHPLVHEWAKARENPSSQQTIWLHSACVLCLACNGAFAWMPIFDVIKSHVRSCFGENMQKYVSKPSRDVALLICDQLYFVSYRSDDLDTAANVLQTMRSLIRREKADDLKMIYIERLFAMLKTKKEELKEAIKLLEHVVQVYEYRLDEADPERLASQNGLARAYVEDGQISKGIELLEHVVKVGALKLDEAHPSRLTSQHELASAYIEDGQISKGIELLEQVVKVRALKLDEAHPSRLSSQHELARAYIMNGQTSKAVEILEHVIEVKKLKLDEAHPSRLASESVLAWAYEEDGQLSKAIALYDHVLRMTELRLGADHPETKRCRAILQEAREEIESLDPSSDSSDTDSYATARSEDA